MAEAKNNKMDQQLTCGARYKPCSPGNTDPFGAIMFSQGRTAVHPDNLQGCRNNIKNHTKT